MNKHSFLLILMISIFAISCKDDPVETPEPPSTSSVIIANEGVFPAGVGTLTTYDPNSGAVNNNVFQKANTYPLGPVVNSLLVEDERIWVVVNGSGVVYVINKDTYMVEAKFENLSSPRYVVKVTDDKYYISDWGINGVHVVNMKNGTIIKTLKTGLGPENMLVADSLVFVVNNGGFNNSVVQDDSTVTIFHTMTDDVVDTLWVGNNPNSLAMDDQGYVWVLSPGKQHKTTPSLSTPGSLHRINVDSIEVDSVLFFADNQLRPANLIPGKNGEIMYFLENNYSGGIMRFTPSSGVVPIAPFISGGFYSLGYDAINDEIYGGSANDFVSAGTVRRYTSDGTQEAAFGVGIIPTDFGFK